MFDEGRRILNAIHCQLSWLCSGPAGGARQLAESYSEVEARKKGDVSRNAETVAAPNASRPKLPRCIVLN